MQSFRLVGYRTWAPLLSLRFEFVNSSMPVKCSQFIQFYAKRTWLTLAHNFVFFKGCDLSLSRKRTLKWRADPIVWGRRSPVRSCFILRFTWVNKFEFGRLKLWWWGMVQAVFCFVWPRDAPTPRASFEWPFSMSSFYKSGHARRWHLWFFQSGACSVLCFKLR